MFSWILKIMPKLDEGNLRAMERSLSSRFARVAKSFGKGLVTAIKGGGVAGLALGLIDKLLNPLEEVQAAIDRTLKSSDDVTTYAKEFNTTSGKLLKVITLAKAAGLDQDSLFQMIGKFQGAVAEANSDPKKQTSVRAFAGEKDILEGFFQFMQSSQNWDANLKKLSHDEVFGGKLTLKAADFSQTKMGEAMLKLGLNKVNTEKLTKDNDKLGALNDLDNELQAVGDLYDIGRKAGVMNKGIINARESQRELIRARENQNIANFQNLAAIKGTMDKIFMKIEAGLGIIGGFIEKATPLIDSMLGFFTTKTGDKIVRYLFSRGGTK